MDILLLAEMDKNENNVKDKICVYLSLKIYEQVLLQRDDSGFIDLNNWKHARGCRQGEPCKFYVCIL